MPINAPPEYFKAEERFLSAKTKEEKIIALEEMIRLLPKHKGTENMLAQLKSKLAKLKKEKSSKLGKKIGIEKKGEAQVCLIGLTNSGKSWLLSKLTNAKPKISEYPFTTTRPEVGMMDYNGIKIQLVEIPSTFESEYISIVRSTDAIAIVIKNEDEIKEMEQLLKDNFITSKYIIINSWKEGIKEIKEKIWSILDLIIVYTKKSRNQLSPMALPKNSTVRDFAQRIHKDFVKKFRFARLWRNNIMMQVGLDYKLENNDIVEIHLK
ncbi:MAG: TGS domain-containing protein [Candidatus Aenigmatarchaeota archaeon]